MAESRGEYLIWCRTRALEYLARGQRDDIALAFASFISDMGKRDDTRERVMLVADLFTKTALIDDDELARAFAESLICSIVEVALKVKLCPTA